MGKRKKPAANPARGFATTSVPSKAKPPATTNLEDTVLSKTEVKTPVVPEPQKGTGGKIEKEYIVPTEEEQDDFELQCLVEKQGPKVRKETLRIVNKAEAEKRTIRNICFPLNHEKIFRFNLTRYASKNKLGEVTEQEIGLGEQILRLAREEDAQLNQGGESVWRGDAVLVDGWIVQRALIAMGFPIKRVEEGLQALVAKSTNPLGKEKGLELAIEETIEWLALNCGEEELPAFVETTGAGNGTRKGDSGPSDVTPAETGFSSGSSTPHITSADTRHLSTRGSRQITNLSLESKDVSNKGEPFNDDDDEDEDDDDDDDDDDDGEKEEEEEEEEEEEDMAPEQLIPQYINIQTQIYNLHPASTIIATGNKGKGGKGRKQVKLPAGLSEEKMKELKKLQNMLEVLSRDPLFDLREAEYVWSGERVRLAKEGWSKKQPEGKWAEKNPKKLRTPRIPSPPTPESDDEESSDGGISLSPSSEPAIVSFAEEYDSDQGLMGGLFEPPPTEETTVGQPEQEKVSIRNFEEVSSTGGTFGKGKPKGKAGVGSAAVKRVLEEVCKSRDINSKIRYELIPGTSISTRSRLTINWSSTTVASSIEATPASDERPPIVVTTPSLLSTVFSMASVATPTDDQAEGYIATHALYQLCSKKDERVYIRLPTIWRVLWSELVEDDRLKSELRDRETLRGLKKLLGIGGDRNEMNGGNQAEKKKRAVKGDAEAGEDDAKDIPQVLSTNTHQSRVIIEGWQCKINTPSYLHMLKGRQQLPMWGFKDEVLAAIEAEQVVIICGETGCGKSTQTPAFILEHELSQGRPCKIYCTEPRRISAISLARRVSEELGERKTELGGKSSLVGYAIRLESNMHAGTRLIYATTGIVMRMLERSPELEEVTHLILDEVHERSIDSDFLMVVLKKLLLRRKDLKVVLMSATVDADKFSNYLDGAPVLNVPGRTFPVRTYYLEDAIQVTGFKVEEDSRNPRNRNDWADDNDVEIDTEKIDVLNTPNLANYPQETKIALSRLNPRQIPYELIVRLLEKVAFSPEYLNYSKAILIFLPGMGEIRRLNDLLSVHPSFSSNKRDGGWFVYPLHSTIATEDQEAAFLVPPRGMRKIVIATNIAETGITIPDVTCVIDSGKHKEMRFDERKQLSRLAETFISRANAKQRRGRAGRVQEGLCFHLFTRDRHDQWMADQQTPEMMRLSLQDLALRVKICKLGAIEQVLSQALDAPLPKNIRRAIDSLVEAKALTAAEELTPLGRQLAKLPLDVYLGKLVLLGCIYGCLDAAVTIAALLSSKSPFVAPMGYRKEADIARFSFKRGDSDLLTGWNAYSMWRRVCQGNNILEADFCRKNYLSGRTLSGIEELKQQLVVAVIDAGFFSLTSDERNYLNRCRFTTYRRRDFFVVPQSVNHSGENDAIVNAVIAAGFYPKLLTRDGKGWRNVINNQNIAVHPNSVNRITRSEWLTCYTIMQSNNFYAQETSHVDEITVALLCGDVDFRMYAGVVIIDGNRVRFSFQDWKSMIALKILRSRLKDITNRSFRMPGKGLSENQKKWLEIFYLVYQRVQ